MAKTKTGNGKIYSDGEVQMARCLYVSGETLDRISRRTGIPVSTLGRFSRAGKWLDDRFPKISVDDLYDALLMLAMRSALKLMFDERSGDEEMAEIDKMRKYIFAMKALCDIAPMESTALVSLMKFALAKHGQNPALRPALDIMQEFYNARAGVENEEQETQAGGE